MSQLPVFDDGLLRFALKGPDGAEIPCEVDALLASTIADQLARRHQLTIEDGEYVYTEEFLAELVAAYRARFGLPTITGQVANRIWLAAQLEVHALKKNTSAPPKSAGSTESAPSGESSPAEYKSP